MIRTAGGAILEQFWDTFMAWIDILEKSYSFCILGQDLSKSRFTSFDSLMNCGIIFAADTQRFLFMWVEKKKGLVSKTKGTTSRCSYSSQCDCDTHDLPQKFFFLSPRTGNPCTLINGGRDHLSWLNACGWGGSFFRFSSRISTINLGMSSRCFPTRLYYYQRSE